METLAEEYPSDPLKVHESALLTTAFSKRGAGVGTGAGFAKVLATANALISVDSRCMMFVVQDRGKTYGISAIVGSCGNLSEGSTICTSH